MYNFTGKFNLSVPSHLLLFQWKDWERREGTQPEDWKRECRHQFISVRSNNSAVHPTTGAKPASLCLFLCVFPPAYRVGWLSVWACPGLWRSIWSESRLSDCKWTACPRDARQLSGSPRKQQAGSEGGGKGVSVVQLDEHHVPPSLLQYKFVALPQPYGAQYIVHMWLWITYSWTDGEKEMKESGPWLQSISCGINAYIRGSFWAICWMWRKWECTSLF